jgi:signal transduction histidine kinase
VDLGALFSPSFRPGEPRRPSDWYTRAMERLIEVVQTLSLARDLPAITAIVRDAARELTGADGASFVLRDGASCHYVDESAIAPLWKGRRFPMSQCVSGWVMINKAAVVIEDIYADPRVPADVYRSTFVKSLAMVPIRTLDPAGAIGIYWAARHRPTEEEMRLLQTLADTTAVAMENVGVYTLLEKRVRDMAVLMSAAPVAIVSLSPSGSPQTWNAAAERLFEESPLLALGEGRPGIDPASAGAFQNLLATIRSGQPVLGETIRGRSRSGGGIDIRVWGAPVADPAQNGGLRALLLVLEDETDRKRLERQIVQSQKMDAVGQLTGGIAHDFNNLLGVLIGNLDLIREKVEDDGGLVDLVDAALDAGLRGTDLNKRLLAFSRRQSLQPEAVDPNAAITGMVKLLRRALGERVEIRLACAEEVWPVKVDPVQLETAVINLCINARDAMPAGGVLTIETANVTIDAPYADLHDEMTAGDYVMIAVSDNGTGMAPEVLRRVFEPFFTTKDAGHGTGLGLPMVYGFLKQSSGHVNIYSEQGLGTTVRLYLPRLEAGEALSPAAAMAVPAAAAAERELVLVVEDNPDVRRIVALLLKGLGYRLIEAATADQALDLIDAGLMPDLLFADVSMPGRMDGIDLANTLRGRFPGLPILLTSGFTERTTADSRKRTGGVGFQMLSKPYRKDDLARALRAALGHRDEGE